MNKSKAYLIALFLASHFGYLKGKIYMPILLGLCLESLLPQKRFCQLPYPLSGYWPVAKTLVCNISPEHSLHSVKAWLAQLENGHLTGKY